MPMKVPVLPTPALQWTTNGLDVGTRVHARKCAKERWLSKNKKANVITVLQSLTPIVLPIVQQQHEKETYLATL